MATGAGGAGRPKQGPRGRHAEGSATSDHPADLPRFIRDNLPLAAVATVPEVVLHLAGPASGLRRLARRDGRFGAPYWAHLWGGGLALARHVLDHPDVVAGRRVLDLGAGSGLVGIAAAKAGAATVMAADIDPYAIAAIALNAAANAVDVAAVLGDPLAAAPAEVDVVLVGDLFYDAALAGRVTDHLDRCQAGGRLVLIGDPGRAFLPRARLRSVWRYPGPDFAVFGGAGGAMNTVFAFEGAAPAG